MAQDLERYWLGGPCEENGKEVWLVIDGNVTHASRENDWKELQAFQGSLEECERMIERLNSKA